MMPPDTVTKPKTHGLFKLYFHSLTSAASKQPETAAAAAGPSAEKAAAAGGGSKAVAGGMEPVSETEPATPEVDKKAARTAEMGRKMDEELQQAQLKKLYADLRREQLAEARMKKDHADAKLELVARAGRNGRHTSKGGP